MAFIRRVWTPKEAEHWTREDTITIVISPIVYMLLMIGGALGAMLRPVGFVLFGLGIVLLLVMIYIINPKLSAISAGYETKQKEYLEELERKIRWED
ncbi:MAG: hypothetical protein JSV33_09410 [bacterium]|nr:MAG: hypothetical protein JSV33_09410 [bacterium]